MIFCHSRLANWNYAFISLLIMYVHGYQPIQGIRENQFIHSYPVKEKSKNLKIKEAIHQMIIPLFSVHYWYFSANGIDWGNRNQQPYLYQSFCSGDDAEDHGLWFIWLYQQWLQCVWWYHCHRQVRMFSHSQLPSWI